MRAALSKEVTDEMFVKLKDLPSDISHQPYNVLYYFDNRSNTNFCFMICINLMIKYNLDKQEITQRYEQTLRYPERSCIDPHNEILYIIDQWKNWITFNIQTNEWNLDFYSHQGQSGKIQTLFFIPKPLNQLHAIWCDRRG